MTGNDTYERLRALFLAALMVFSVFGATVAFAGSAAAAVNSGSLTEDSTGPYQPGDSVEFSFTQGEGNTDVQVWIDANGDEDFDTGETNKTIKSADFAEDGSYSGSINLASDATDGTNYKIAAIQQGTALDGDESAEDTSGTFEVDGTPPQNPTSTTVSTATPINSNTDTSVDVDVTFDNQPESGTVYVLFTDDSSDTVEASTDAETNSKTTAVTGTDISGLNDGQITVEAKIIDDAGNENSNGYTAASNFQKDTVAPTFDSATTGDSADGGSTANDSVFLAFTEDTSGIDASTVSDTDFTVSTADVNVQSTQVTDGDNIILTLDSDLPTGETPDVTLNSDESIQDNAGNALSGAVQRTAEDGLVPVIFNYQVTKNQEDNVDVRFDATEQLGTISASVDGPADVTGTLTETDFAEDTTSYSDTFSDTSTKGEYTITLNTAKDDSPNANAASTGQTGSVIFGNARDASITASPSGEGETSTHNVTWTLASDTSVDTYEVDYPSADISSVDADSIVKFGIDTDGDGAVETDLSGEVDSIGPNSGDNTLLTVDTSSKTTISDGDRVILEYSDAVNPSGNEDVALRLDPDTGDVDVTRTLAIDKGVAPTVTDITISGTPVKTGDLFGEEVNGTGQTLAVQFNKDMDTNDQPNVTLTVDGQDVTISDGAFAEGDASLWEGTVDVDVDNSEVDASVSVSEATGTDGNSLESTSNSFEIDTAPLGIDSATAGEEDLEADSDVVYVTLNDTYQNADGDDFTVIDDDENDITYVAEGYGNEDQIELDLDTPQPANETPTVTLHDNGITDDAGNGVSSTTQQVEATDGVAPDVTEFSDSVSADQITFTVVADEPLNTSSIEVDVDGTIVTGFSAVDGETNTYEATSTEVADSDQYTAELTAAEDEAGNDYTDDGTDVKSTSPDVDTSGPTFELVKPADDPTQENSEIDVEIADQTGVNTSSIYVTVEDADGVIYDRARAEVTADIDIVDIGTDSAVDDVSIGDADFNLNLADGQVNVTVEAKDDNGYSNSAEFTYEVDTQVNDGEVVAPSETVYKPTDGTLQVKYNYVDSNVDVSYVKLVDTDDASASTVTYKINDSDYVDDGTNKTITLDLSEAGKDGNSVAGDTDYQVQVTVDDALGNTYTDTTEEEWVVIDDTAPVVSGDTIADMTNSQTNFSFNIADDDTYDSGVDASSIWLEINQSSETLFEGTTANASVSFDSGTVKFDTVEAGISYENNASVHVNVSVADNVGNTLDTSTNDGSAFTFDVNAANPTIQSVDAEAESNTVDVTFEGPVFTNADGTGALDATFFAYQSSNGGATAIDSVEHKAGDSTATLVLDSTVTASDIGSDMISWNENVFSNLAAVSVDHSETYALEDQTVPANPSVILGNITKSNEDTYTVTLHYTGETGIDTADITLEDENSNTVSNNGVDVSSGENVVEVPATALGNTAIDVSVTTHELGADLTNTVEVEDAMYKDNESADITSVETNAGTNVLTVTFNETVKNADSKSAFDLENMSFSDSGTETVVDNGDDTVTLYVDEPVSPSDLQNEDVTVSATSDVTDVVGTQANTADVKLSDDTEPSVDHARSTNGSAEVTVSFEEMVYNADDGNLTADNFSYVNKSGVDRTIESVEHTAGEESATLVLNDSMTAANLNEDAVSLTVYDSEDNELSTTATISDTIDADIDVKNDGYDVTITVESNEELDTFNASIFGYGDLTEFEEDNKYVESIELDQDDFTASEEDGTFVYTYTESLPRDGEYGAVLKDATTVGGTSTDWAVEHNDAYKQYSSTVVDVSDLHPRDAEITNVVSEDNAPMKHAELNEEFENGDFSGVYTNITVQFNEPVKWEEQVDEKPVFELNVGSNTYKSASINPDGHEGEVVFTVEGEVATGDAPDLSIKSNELMERYNASGAELVDDSAATTLNTAEIHLSSSDAGVNFVSVPAATGSLDISGLDDSNVESIMTYDRSVEGNWATWTPESDNADDFDELKGGVGYIVKVDGDTTWDVNVYNTADGGDSAATATPQQTHLEEGWNLVGHWQEGNQQRGVALSTVRNSVHSGYEQNADGEWSYSGVHVFEPGEAYWVFVNDDEVYGETPYGWSQDR